MSNSRRVLSLGSERPKIRIVILSRMSKANAHTVDDPCHWPLTVPSWYEEGWQRVASGEVAIDDD